MSSFFWQLQTLWLSIASHMIFTITVVALAWFLLGRWTRIPSMKWYYPIVLGTVVSTYVTGDRMIHLHQSTCLVQAQADRIAEDAKKTAVAPLPAPANDQEFFKMKGDFLRTVDVLTSQPAQITSDVRLQLFVQFRALFPRNEQDRLVYGRAIYRAYECQRFFYEDALASIKAQKALKSEERKVCEQESGEFFNRPKLMPPEMIAGNDKLIEVASGRKPADANSPAIDAPTLRASLEAQIRRMDGVRKLFE